MDVLIWCVPHLHCLIRCQLLKGATYSHHARREFTEIINNAQESLKLLCIVGGSISIRTLILHGSGCILVLDITSPKHGMDVHLKWHLSLLSFRLTSLHLCYTFLTVLSWSLPVYLYHTIKMSSAMPNIFDMSLKISSIICWNILPAGGTPNGSYLYLYLPNCHANVIRYDDLSSSRKLWYPELTSIRESYLSLLSFGSILFEMGPLCTGLISAWFNCAGSRHSLTLPLALGTSTKLLHHSEVSLTSRDAIMSCCSSLFNSS